MTPERHFSPTELAAQWGVSTSYIRSRFRHEPGVVKLGKVLRIPESVALRVYRVSTVGASPAPAKSRARRTRDGTVVLAPTANNVFR